MEKSFDNLKNELNLKRLRTHNSNTTDGKIFKQLNNIKILNNNNEKYTKAPLTSKQKKILKEFDITEDLIDNYLAGI